MKRISQSTLPLAILIIGVAGGATRADERQDKPQPMITADEKIRLAAAKSTRTFGSLLQKGQTVTLYQLPLEAPTCYQYQVRIISDDQKKQIENAVVRNQKHLDDYNDKKAKLEEQLVATYEVAGFARKIKEPERHAELKKAINDLRASYKYTSLPVDIRSDKFCTISDVGSDYVGFERNGVETYHRMSSIHRIIRGVEMDEE